MQIDSLKGKRIYAYVRVSRDVQDAERQRDTIREWATHNDLVIEEWYEDTEGSNPRDLADKRINFQRLIQLVATGLVDAVVVDAQDRFGTAGAWELGKYLTVFIDSGCSLWSVSDGCLTEEDDGTVIKAVVNAQTSRKEQRDKSWRSLNKKIDKARDGEYPGGYPPYGLDVVCFDPLGQVKWRVVWIGDFRRVKVEPDGRETLYEGKNNMPAKDEHDVLRYAPSIQQERLSTIQDIFRWYATENISPSQIATRLNSAGVDAVFGEGWNKQKIKQTLMNPVYIGLPAFNKRASGRFWEHVDGKMQPVKKNKGRTKAGRTRQQSDYIFPARLVFEPPIIEVTLFNTVQRKLHESSKEYKEKVPTPRSPRTASFWLRNLLFCSGCMKPMRAWNANPNTESAYRSYFCANYGTYGKVNPTGCKSNRVKAELLEEITERYLRETHEKIASLIEAKTDKDVELICPLESDLEQKRNELLRLFRHQSRFVHRIEQEEGDLTNAMARVLIKNEDVDENGSVPLFGTEEIYDYLYEQRKPSLESELSRLDAEHSELLDKALSLPKKAAIAREKVNARILQIEERIQALRDDLHHVTGDIDALIQELERRKNAIQEAREAIGEDSSYRRKTALVKQVISKIICHFRDTDGKGNQPRTELVKVEVLPVEGDVWTCYPDGIKPEKD